VKVRKEQVDQEMKVEPIATAPQERVKRLRPLFSFEDLQSVLPEAVQPLPQFSVDHSGKPVDVNSIVGSETEQMKAVLQHPSFARSPLNTIHVCNIPTVFLFSSLLLSFPSIISVPLDPRSQL